MTRKQKYFKICILLVVIIAGCSLTITSVNQPSQASYGSSFGAVFSVTIDPSGNTLTDPPYGIIGLLVPKYCGITSVRVIDYVQSSPSYQYCHRLMPGVSDSQPGEGIDDWFAELNTEYPVIQAYNMEWRIYETNTPCSIPSQQVVRQVQVLVNLAQTVPGTYNFRYFVSTAGMTVGTGDVSGDHPLHVLQGTAVEEQNQTSVSYQLLQNYPNPFNSSTKISFNLPEPGLTSVKIYDPMGKEIAVLADTYLEQGPHQVDFNDETVPSGIYFYVLRSGSFRDMKRMVLLR